MNNLENKGKGKNIVIFILSVLLICALGFICYKNFLKGEKVIEKDCKCPACEKCNFEKKENKCSYSLTDLYATYYGEKEHPNNNSFVHKVELTLGENNEAILHQSDGAASDYSKGTFVCEYDRIVYTPLYYDYEGDKNSEYQKNIQYTFIVNKDELNYFYASTFPIVLKRK